MAWDDLKAAVAAVINTNGTQSITGAVLQSTLNSIIDQVGANLTFKGVATTSTNPGTPDGPTFYLAYQSGTYSNFGALVVSPGEMGILEYIPGTGWGLTKVQLSQKLNSILATIMLEYDYADVIELNAGNYYLNSSGVAVANDNCRISGFIDVTKAKYLVPLLYIYGLGYCAYYSSASEGGFIAGSAFQVDNTKFGTTFSVPSNATHIRVSAFVAGSSAYKNDYPVAILAGNKKENALSVIQKPDARNVKVNGVITGIQRWGTSGGNYFKLKFPESSVGLSGGISYLFDVTIRKLEPNTASKNNYLKLRIEFFRYPSKQYIPNVTVVGGNPSLINSVKLLYKLDSGETFRVPYLVLGCTDTLTGIVVDNMNISVFSNTDLTVVQTSNFIISETSDISDLTLIGDYSTILSSGNLPLSKSQAESLFIGIDDAPSKQMGSSAYSSQVDPETGASNSFYRTIYKRIKGSESKVVAKVWGSSTGQKLFRAFDVDGVVLPAYSRNTQSGEDNVILTLEYILGPEVASYSAAYVTAGTPDPSNANMTLYYGNIGSYIEENVQVQIDDINAKIKNGSKYVDLKGVGSELSKFLTLANQDHGTPLNVLFLGDSIVNFQNAWNNGESAVYQDKPLCLYNRNTFTNRIWELLNPGALYYDKSQKQYGGSMQFLKANPTPGNLTPSTGVTISGTWLSNITGSNYNTLGDCGGHPVAGWKEFLFSKTAGDYIEFQIPAGSLGFSVVAECSTGTRSSDGSNYYNHSSSIQVYLDGVLEGIINNANKNGNVRFDFVLPAALGSTGVVKVLLTESNKWVGIWGVESWSSKRAVRPINNGLASHSISEVLSKYESTVTSADPDIIFFCGMINNDSRLLESEVRQSYETMWTNLSALDVPIIGLSTHWGTYNRMYYNPVDMNHDDPRHVYSGGVWIQKGYHPAYLRIFLNWCKEHGIPVINPCQYMYDEYGDDSTPFMVDVAHLNVAGHNLYKGLIDIALIGNY